MMSTRAFCVLLCSLITTAALPAAQPAVQPEREYPSVTLDLDRNLEFAQNGGRSLFLDLYRPRQATNPVPVLVWIHGEAGPFAGRYPCPIASMVGCEYAVASIDYRASNEIPAAGQLDDCQAAIRWLRANAAKYNLDASHIGAWGFSEGGRLAVRLGATGEARELAGSGASPGQSSAVQAVVDFAGRADRDRDKGLQALPLASGSTSPTMILHGAADPVTPPAESEMLDAGLRQAGAKSTLVVVKDAGHEFKQLRQGEQVERVNNFLDDQLKNGAHVRFRLCKIDPPADAWVDPIIDEPEGTLYQTFAAASLGPNGLASYLVYLPPGYETSSARYPVLYYLHGANGGQRVGDGYVQKLDAAIRAHTVPPMIAVLVQGLPRGSYRDSADGKTPIESVIMNDLIPHIDSTYRTIPRREARVLEGLSMGGYGVFHLGFKFPEKFGMISGMCNGIGASGATWNTSSNQSPYELADNPYALAQKNLDRIKDKTPIRIIVGTDDFTLDANKQFDAYLTKVGIPHDFKIVPGVYHGYKEYYQILDFSFFKTVATK